MKARRDPHQRSPYYPTGQVSFSEIYFFLKHKQLVMNPFNKEDIKEHAILLLAEARKTAPSYKMFIDAAMKATGHSKATIDRYLRQGQETGLIPTNKGNK